MTKFILSLFSCFLMAQNATAEVLIQAPGVGNDVFAAVPQTDTSYVSLVDMITKDRPSKTESGEIESKLERAQNLFLAGSEEEAQKAFLQVAKLSLNADWNASQRQAILYSFLRAAQLIVKSKEREELLLKAARFAPDLDPDTQLFPPPLLTTYKDFREREIKSSLTYPITEKFAGYDLIIVDGRRYDTEKETQVSLTTGEHRISLISNSRLPLTQKMNSSQLSIFKADSKPLALGSCDEPALTGLHELELSAVSVMYGVDCIRSFTGTSWLRKDADNKAGAMSLMTASPESIQSNGFAPSLKDEDLVEHKLSTRQWVWIGVGSVAVAASAYLIIQNQRSHRGETIQPSRREGF